jgi:hypothetical protein
MILVLNWPCDRCEYESTNGFNSLSIFPMLELSKRSESLFYVEEMWFSACKFFRSETSERIVETTRALRAVTTQS